MTIFDVTTCVVTDFNERSKEEKIDFYFRINGAQYHMVLFRDFIHPNRYQIMRIFQPKKSCRFCTEEEKKSDFCAALFRQKKEVFQMVIRHSKNRLRWLNATIH